MNLMFKIITDERGRMSAKGPIFILSIDGGGSRGVIPANILYHLEHDAAIAVRKSFDFFTGGSTGAMIAAYLATHGTVVGRPINSPLMKLASRPRPMPMGAMGTRQSPRRVHE